MKHHHIALRIKQLSLLISAALLAGCGNQGTVQTSPMEHIQDGVILHCFDWSYVNIESEMDRIAKSGYTAVQVSCIQPAKEYTAGKTNEYWWLLYQPIDFCIDDTGHSALGTKAEFESMCDSAHAHNIKVIVDVVANHLGNEEGYDISEKVDASIRENNDYWHATAFDSMQIPVRETIINNSVGGLPDLNTENADIQTMVSDFLAECIDAGADGFRFDCAKHIGVPSEGSDFWPNVIGNASEYYQEHGYFKDTTTLYCYGEILGETNGPDISEYTEYMSVTDNDTGNTIRERVATHGARGAATSKLFKGAEAEKTVLWAESHDTYENEDKQSTNVSTEDINKTWAIVAAKNDICALYFARTLGYRGGMMGNVCSEECFSEEVVAVNQFHNRHDGEETVMSSLGSIVVTERESGAILVNVDGMETDVTVNVTSISDGKYIDQITGNQFTVKNGSLSGSIGNTGIAVLERK